MVLRRHLIVRGRVQGVFFRAHTQEMGRKLGLSGWVRNLPDGSVEIAAEGEEEKMKEFLSFCRQGPPLARVKEVLEEDLKSSEPLPFPFTIRY